MRWKPQPLDFTGVVRVNHRGEMFARAQPGDEAALASGEIELGVDAGFYRVELRFVPIDEPKDWFV